MSIRDRVKRLEARCPTVPVDYAETAGRVRAKIEAMAERLRGCPDFQDPTPEETAESLATEVEEEGAIVSLPDTFGDYGANVLIELDVTNATAPASGAPASSGNRRFPWRANAGCSLSAAQVSTTGRKDRKMRNTPS